MTRKPRRVEAIRDLMQGCVRMRSRLCAALSAAGGYDGWNEWMIAST